MSSSHVVSGIGAVVIGAAVGFTVALLFPRRQS